MRRYFAQFRQLESCDLAEWKTHAVFYTKTEAIEFIVDHTKPGRMQGRVLCWSKVIWAD